MSHNSTSILRNVLAYHGVARMLLDCIAAAMQSAQRALFLPGIT